MVNITHCSIGNLWGGRATFSLSSYLVQVNLILNQMAKPLHGVMGQLGVASTSRVRSLLLGELTVVVVNAAAPVAVNDNHDKS